MAKDSKSNNLSRGDKGAVSQPVSGPIRQKHRLAMGEAVNGETNPYGSDAPSGKPTTKGKNY